MATVAKQDASAVRLKHAGMQCLAGGAAGCVEVSLMQPLDVIKTRFQLQTKALAVDTAVASRLANNPAIYNHHYTGMVDCMRKMYMTEGLLSFWKGILPPILVEMPRRAFGFFTFEQFKTIFNFNKDAPPTPLVRNKQAQFRR